MSLKIKDSDSNIKQLKTTEIGGEHLNHHIIQEISGSNITSVINKLTDISSSLLSNVVVTASATSPVYVTGSVKITQPVDVEITVSDNISVTSSLAAPLFVSSSANSPVLVTGTVSFNNPNLFVSSSQANPVWSTGTIHVDNSVLYVSSSVIGTSSVTGTVHIDNTSVFVTSSAVLPVWVTGTVTTALGTVSVADGLRVTSSLTNPVYVSSSNATPVWVTGTVTTTIGSVTVADGLRVTSSLTNPLYVSSSITNPVAVYLINQTTGSSNVTATASFGNPIAITGTVAVNNSVLTITSSNGNSVLTSISSSQTNPVWITGTVSPAITASITTYATVSVGTTVTASIYGSPASSFSKNKYRVGDSVFYDTNTSGTFQLAPVSTTRKGLVVHNPTSTKLYITLGSGSLNGFSDVANLQDEPNSYSFILYPSGTYIADLSLVNLFHGGWFVSSSTVNGAMAFVTTTE